MKISGFENLVSIDKFYYKITTNAHEYCQFDISINEDDIDTYIGMVDSDCNIQEENFSFKGIITDICIYRDKYCSHAKVTLIGQTKKKLDVEKKCRIFQNPDKKQTEILDKAEMTKRVVEFTGEKDDNVNIVILQDNETNWSFLLRLAKMWGFRVFPGEKTTLGLFIKENSVSIKEDDIIYFKQYYAKEQKRIKCRLRTNLNFGDKLTFHGEKYVVDKIIVKKKHCAYLTFYYFTQYVDEAIPEKTDYYLKAKVTCNEDPDKMGKIQVQFGEPYYEDDKLIYEDVMSDKQIWIETETFFANHDTGISFLPEVDDIVFIHIYNGIPTIQSVVRTEKLPDKFEDYNAKYIFFKNDRYFQCDEKEIIFANKKGLCKISDENVIFNWNEEKISAIVEDEKITVKNDKSTVEMKTDEISINSDKNISLEKSKKITLKSTGGKIIIENNVDINGNEIHLN